MKPKPSHTASGRKPAAAAAPEAAGGDVTPAAGLATLEPATPAASVPRESMYSRGQPADHSVAAAFQQSEDIMVAPAAAAPGTQITHHTRRRSKHHGQQGTKWKKRDARMRQQHEEEEVEEQEQQPYHAQQRGPTKEEAKHKDEQQDEREETHCEGPSQPQREVVEMYHRQSSYVEYPADKEHSVQLQTQQHHDNKGAAFCQQHRNQGTLHDSQKAVFNHPGKSEGWEQQQEEGLLQEELQLQQQQEDSREYDLPHLQKRQMHEEPKIQQEHQQQTLPQLLSVFPSVDVHEQLQEEKGFMVGQQPRFLQQQKRVSHVSHTVEKEEQAEFLEEKQKGKSVGFAQQRGPYSENISEVLRGPEQQGVLPHHLANATTGAAAVGKGKAALSRDQLKRSCQMVEHLRNIESSPPHSCDVAATAARGSACTRRHVTQAASATGAAAGAPAASTALLLPQQQQRYPEQERGYLFGGGKRSRRIPRWLPIGCLDRKGEPPLHANIYLMIYFRVLNAVAYAARAASIFDAYLFLRFGGNRAIGTLTVFSGLITVVVAPFAGFVCDIFKSQRSNFLRGAAIFTLLCTYVYWRAVQDDNFGLLIISTFLWKGWYEFVSVCSESLFNDCIPPGRRSELYIIRRIATTLANGVGPLLSLLVFAIEGNTWSLPVLHSVLCVGTVLSLPQVLLLWWWEDVGLPHDVAAPALPQSEQEQQQQHSHLQLEEEARAYKDAGYAGKEQQHMQVPTQQQQETVLGQPDIEQQLLEQPQDGLDETKRGRRDSGKEREERRHGRVPRVVPWLIFISHCVTFCGAGMTVKYFPLYFKTEYNFKPIHSCLLSSTYTLFIVAFTYAIQRVAMRWGRAQASLVFTALGVSCLFLLVRLRNLPLVILVYLLRGAFQNASTPLDRSLVMDCIDLKHVGKWSALQSLATMMWSLSALVGGLIADKVSYRSTFVITGCVYVISEIVYLPILWLLPPNFDERMRALHQA